MEKQDKLQENHDFLSMSHSERLHFIKNIKQGINEGDEHDISKHFVKVEGDLDEFMRKEGFITLEEAMGKLNKVK